MRSFVTVAVFLAMGCAGAPPRPMQRLPSGAMPFLSVEHVNAMSATFELIALHLDVDGREVAALESEQPLPSRVCLSRGVATPGAHEIRLRARYRGHGFGVFSYLSGYRFNTAGATRVEIPADAEGLEVRSEGYENEGATAPLEERPHIRFSARVEGANPGGGCVPAAPVQTVAP